MFLRAAIARPKPASSNSPHSTRNKKKSKRKEPLRQYIVKCWWLYFDFKLIIGKCFGFCYADDVHFQYAIKKYKRQFSTAKIKTPSHCGLPWSQRHRYWYRGTAVLFVVLPNPFHMRVRSLRGVSEGLDWVSQPGPFRPQLWRPCRVGERYL